MILLFEIILGVLKYRIKVYFWENIIIIFKFKWIYNENIVIKIIIR